MNSPPDKERLMKRVAQWLAFIGATISSFSALFALIYILVSDISFLKTLIQDNPRAIIGLPAAFLSSYCLVLFLEASSGRIEIEGLGFKFRGAAGPIVMWIFVFLAIVTGIAILWKDVPTN